MLLFLMLSMICRIGIYSQNNLIRYVNPFIGTDFHGHTYPGATAPLGGVQLGPDTRISDWDACSGYHYSDSTIIGFSHTHLSGTGCVDLGDILIYPLQNQGTEKTLLMPPLKFSHNNETASPGYYSVMLDNGIRAELTATMRSGVHRYTYPSSKNKNLIIDLIHSLGKDKIYDAQLEVKNGILEGFRITNGWVDPQPVYFSARLSKPISNFSIFKSGVPVKGTKARGDSLQIIINFPDDSVRTIELQVGISLVSVEEARRNREQECGSKTFDKILADTRLSWNHELLRIRIQKGSDKDKTIFYTSLYHAMVTPNVISDVSGKYRLGDQVFSTMNKDHKVYSTFSLWDTYRAWNPLMTIINPDLTADMIRSMLAMYKVKGELPIWPLSTGETHTMIGYHAVSVIADAYLRGIRGFDADLALEAMIKSSDINKKGSDYYIKYGFIPSDLKRESVSCTLEYAYDDWCIARMAASMGRNDVADRYYRRAYNYVHLFDGYSGFFRGKRLDGNWEPNLDPYEISRDFTEANAWQYRFYVPHDIKGLTNLFGGKSAMIQALDSLFSTTSAVKGDLQDITGMIGQYAHGNEPSHHIAYLYACLGQPWKTQEITRRILREMYSDQPDGIIGNEDCGQMSAWYILSSLGFYPVCPGSGEFVITTPLFEKAVVKLPHGKELVITANDPEHHVYIQEVRLNGETIRGNTLHYDVLIKGGKLEYILSDKPVVSSETNTHGVYSLTHIDQVSIPYAQEDTYLFVDSIAIHLGCSTPGAAIYYTLDGSAPTDKSPLYTSALKLNGSATLKARAYLKGSKPSELLTLQAVRAVLMPGSSLKMKNNGVNYSYYEGACSSVKDIAHCNLVKKGVMSYPSIADAPREDKFAYVFHGYIYIDRDGVYDFQTQSDDGSVLSINGTEVVNNDGSHSFITATGRIALARGYHSYEIKYFEDYEGQGFAWFYKRKEAHTFTPIPSRILYIE